MLMLNGPIPSSLLFFPKQWYTEGFWRLGKDIHECTGSSLAPIARQLLSAGCGLGEGQVALVHAKHSLAPLSTEKQICFGTISFRSSSGPPFAQMPPRCLPNVSQMPPRCVSDAFQMPLRCLQMLPRCFPKKTVWGLALG